MGTDTSGAEGYYADTMGRNKEKFAGRIRNRLYEEAMTDLISMKKFINPFTGSTNK